MKKIFIYIATVYLGVASTFAVPLVASANGSCLTGDGTGSLSWNNTGSCQLITDGGTSRLAVFDIADNGTGGSACYTVSSATQFASRLTTDSQIVSFMQTGSGGCTSYSSGGQFAVVLVVPGSCTSYTSCSGVATAGEDYPNMTYNGSVFNFNGSGPTPPSPSGGDSWYGPVALAPAASMLGTSTLWSNSIFIFSLPVALAVYGLIFAGMIVMYIKEKGIKPGIKKGLNRN